MNPSPPLPISQKALQVTTMLASSPTPPPTPPGRPPSPATPLLGRDRDLGNVRDLLARADVRLVSLIGPGGVGKTRLALACQYVSADDFADGARWVALVGVTDAARVWMQVAAALGVPNPREGLEALAAVKAALQTKSLLLVLDNFEQLVATAPQVAELLEACPQLKILVTSRRPLRLRCEHEYPVRPLELPPLDAPLRVVSDNPAAQLFAQRARAVNAGFELSFDNAGLIAQICTRLDGLPLALELAASRLRLFTPASLLAQLSAPLDALVGGARDLSRHQRSLRATLEWSLALLSDAQRQLFAQLGAFAGGFSLEAALIVSGADALPDLEMLVEHSLVTVTDGRFTMLETIRERAVEMLEADPDAADVLERHARYFLMLCQRSAAEIYGADQTRWIEQLEGELDNLRAALRWGLKHQPDLTLQVAALPFPMWSLRNHNAEAADALERALVAVAPQPLGDARAERIRAHALEKLGDYLYILDEFERSDQRHSEALTLWETLGDFERIVAVLAQRSRGADTVGRHDQAASYLTRAHQIALIHGQTSQLERLSFALGLNQFATLDFAAAKLSMSESLNYALVTNAPNAIAGRLMALGMIEHQLGNTQSAHGLLTQALVIVTEHRNVRRTHGVLMALAPVVAELGDAARAEALLEELRQVSLRLSPSSDPRNSGWTVAAVAVAAHAGQHWRAARLVGAAQRLELNERTGASRLSEAMIQRFAAPSITALGADWQRIVDEGRNLEITAILSTAEPITLEPRRAVDGLSAREFQVVTLVADGLSDAEIAAQLGIGRRTVGTHLTSVYNKFGVRSRTQAVREAQRRGLITIT